MNPKCTKCGAVWSGMNTGHCMACHTTFTGITAFDAHRRGGACQTPDSVGLSLTKRAYPCYGYPSDETDHWWTAHRPQEEQ
ncbi:MULTISPECIES: FDXHR family putative zinc-binding protein [unclassified Rhodococcus (in: high G+C Gram-positive bacteria)]|uniref:FDXHR family putative zinc-binding protein n=1 Tax=unclassified Rhodococcus (in: high G+C Gram-positive bacteria) TaxID=192944 RepID=UPI000B208F10